MVIVLCFFWLASFSSRAFGEGRQDVPYLCQRRGHQSTVIGEAAYVFGGIQDFWASLVSNSSAPVQPDYGDVLYRINLSRSWDYKLDYSQFEFISMHDSTCTPSKQLMGGALFHEPTDTQKVYLYGGAPYVANSSDITLDWPVLVSDTLSLFDSLSHSWSVLNSSAVKFRVSRHSSYTQAPNEATAFYLDMPGMVVIDTSTRTTRRIGKTFLPGGNSRVGSQLQYIPELGAKGALVLLGGSWVSANQTLTRRIDDLVSLANVNILDVASLEHGSGIWYEQSTSGRTPGPRVDACVVTVSAPDKSSYNIYMYGGRSPDKIYADVWVLSLPQFHWTKVVQTTSLTFGHTCHLVGSKQMLIIGGNQSSNPSRCATNRAGIRLLDLTSLQWATNYIVPDPQYQVPRAIVEWIGGSVTGNAMMTRPKDDFSSDGLAALFGERRLQPGDNGRQRNGTSSLQTTSYWILCIHVTLSILFCTVLHV